MPQKESKKKNFWSWRIGESELKNQVDNYRTLKITESYRGISVLFMTILLALSLLLAFVGVGSDVKDVVLGMTLYLPIMFFVYIGSNRWAIITLMALWTFEKVIQIYGAQNATGVISPIIWWVVIMSFFWKTLQVENKKLAKSKEDSDISITSDEEKK